jgi:hypothetical protein
MQEAVPEKTVCTTVIYKKNHPAIVANKIRKII